MQDDSHQKNSRQKLKYYAELDIPQQVIIDSTIFNEELAMRLGFGMQRPELDFAVPEDLDERVKVLREAYAVDMQRAFPRYYYDWSGHPTKCVDYARFTIDGTTLPEGGCVPDLKNLIDALDNLPHPQEFNKARFDRTTGKYVDGLTKKSNDEPFSSRFDSKTGNYQGR